MSKREQMEALVKRLNKSLTEAHIAAEAAVKNYLKTAPLTDAGFVADTCGCAIAAVRKPSYHFREALKSMGEAERWPPIGGWSISDFGKNVKGPASQSYTAYSAACKAAVSVLKTEFPDEDFFVHAWVD